MISPLAEGIAELADDTAVQTLVGTDAANTYRIRPVEPAPGDAKSPGKFVPFVVLSVLDAPWRANTATSAVALGLRCYAETYAEAEALFLACAAVFHRKGPRVSTSGLGVFHSLVQGGGTPAKDPDTSQPYFYGIVELAVSVQPIT